QDGMGIGSGMRQIERAYIHLDVEEGCFPQAQSVECQDLAAGLYVLREGDAVALAVRGRSGASRAGRKEEGCRGEDDGCAHAHGPLPAPRSVHGRRGSSLARRQAAGGSAPAPRYSQPLVQVSWMTIRLNCGTRGERRSQSQDRKSVV